PFFAARLRRPLAFGADDPSGVGGAGGVGWHGGVGPAPSRGMAVVAWPVFVGSSRCRRAIARRDQREQARDHAWLQRLRPSRFSTNARKRRHRPRGALFDPVGFGSSRRCLRKFWTDAAPDSGPGATGLMAR